MSEMPDIVQLLPTNDSPVAVLGSINCVMSELGRELGTLYIPLFRAAWGTDWRGHLESLRERKINPFDPHFVLLEPLKFPDSPVRTGLKLNGIQLELLDKALAERNRWAHHDSPPLTLDSLYESVKPFHEVATALQLGRLGKLCAETRKRIKNLQTGLYEAQSPVETHLELEVLKENHGLLNAQKAKLEADLQAAIELANAAEYGGIAANEAAQDRIKALEDQLLAAMVANTDMELRIESLAAAARAVEEPWVEVEVGHPWPGDRPGREYKLMALHDDLFDPRLNRPVADDYGDEAKNVIRRWGKFLEPNAQIFCNSHGQCVAFLAGNWTYFGCLRPTESSRMLAAFFLPHRYTLRMNGEIEHVESGLLLTDSLRSSAAQATSERLLGELPEGGELRLTPEFGLAGRINGRWVVLMQADRSNWFQQHLA